MRAFVRIACSCLVACGARTGLDVPGPSLDGSFVEDHAIFDVAADVEKDVSLDVADVVTPPTPDAGQPVPTISAATFACALNASGIVKCWQKYAQASVVPLPTIVDLVVGGAHAFARAQDDSLWVWGSGTACSLGTGTTQPQTISTPVHLTALGNKVEEISASLMSSLALLTDGSVIAWGTGPNGTGGGSTLCTPTALVGFVAPVIKIAQGDQNGCAVLADHRVQCWGVNAYGTLGNGSADIATTVDTPVTGLADAIDVAVSYSHACAVRSGGGVVCWGDDSFGELGDGQMNDGSLTPVDVIGLAGAAVSVTSNLTNTCARLASGPVQCWGSNGTPMNSGSVGNGGSPADVLAPTTIIGGDTIALSEQSDLGCALLLDGSAKCWGDWSTVDDAGSPSPVAVQGLP